MGKRKLKIVGALTVVIISLMTIAFWTTINQGAKDLTKLIFGTESTYIQSGIIIGVGLIMLTIFALFFKGKKIKEAVYDILKL